MAHVELIEDGDAQAFRWGPTGKAHAFRSQDPLEMTSAFRKAVAEGVADGDCGGMADTEREVARELSARAGIEIRKDADGKSLILAWKIPEELAAELALIVPGGQPKENLHLTLWYLGDPAEWDVVAVTAVAKIFSLRWCAFKGSIAGIGRFVGPEDEDVIVALIDCPDLDNFRRSLREDLSYAPVGDNPYNSLYSQEHGYLPHITLAYVPKGSDTPAPLTETIPFEVENVAVMIGGPDGSQSIEFALRDHSDYPSEDAIPYYASRAQDDGPGAPITPEDLQELQSVLAKVQAGLEVPAPESAADALGEEVSEPAPLEYAVTKANEDSRYTLGPLYAPDRKDAHDEFTDAATLQTAVWDYVRESSEKGRRINLQHDQTGDKTVGEWVEVMAWPYEHTIKVALPGEEEREIEMPAGTVYIGVVWDEAAWPLVKSGKLGGYSLGGHAVKMPQDGIDFDAMGDAAIPRSLQGKE